MKDILIIDDSSTSRLYYREILELLGCRVEEAINGLEGLEKLAGRRFDLMLVAVNMPKMDGYTFLDHLRRDPEFRSVPAIMISTEAQERDRVKAYSAGANGYIVKPVDPKELSAVVRLATGLTHIGRKAA